MRILSVEETELRFSATAKYSKWPQTALHTQWPGAGVKGDPIFDSYYSSTVPSLASREQQQSTTQKAGGALLDRIGQPVILFSHSQGMMPAWLIADSRPALVRGIVALEPAGPPFEDAVLSTGLTRPYGLTTLPLTYGQPVTDPAADLVKQSIQPTRTHEVPCLIQAENPPPRRLVNLAGKPVLVVTGEASYHAPYDYATVRYLQQAGVEQTEHLRLEEHGVHGNGHMLFMEKNSDRIAELVEEWISRIRRAA